MSFGRRNATGRPVCQFYLDGKCKFGDNCRNEHPGASNNSFASLGGRGNDRPYELNPDVVKIDLTTERPQWPLSCYGPGRNAPKQLIEGEVEHSPEEMRLLHYLALAKGTPQESAQRESSLAATMDSQIQRIISDVNGAVKYVIDGKDQHPNRIDMINKPFGTQSSSATSGTAFGQPTQTATGFGQPSQPTSMFGRPSQPTSAFGQPSQPTSAFGRPSQPGSSFGQPSAFGRPSQVSTQGSTFGQPSAPTSSFGQPSNPGTSAFGRPTALGGSSPFGAVTALDGATAFGKPSQPGAPAFGQSGFGNAGQRPAFGQSGFGQAGAGSSGTTQSGFGQPSAFGTAANKSSPFASTGTTAGSSTFGQPSAFAGAATGASPFANAGQTNASPFAAAGQQQTGASPFASAQGAVTQPSPFASANSAATQPSPFASAHSAATQPPPFGSNTNSAPSSFATGGQQNTGVVTGFGQASASNPFGSAPAVQPPQAATSSPFAKVNTATPSAFTSLIGSNSQSNSNVRVKNGSGMLTQFKGKPVQYDNEAKTYSYENNSGKKERIWLPDGPPQPCLAVQAAEEVYAGDVGQALAKLYLYVRETGTFENGIVPEIPPKIEWVSFDL